MLARQRVDGYLAISTLQIHHYREPLVSKIAGMQKFTTI